MFARITKLTATTLALAALCVAFAVTATAGTAAKPKPGFMPGTWVGKGTIAGAVDDGPMKTRFSGRIAFVLKVSKSFGVTGTGNWSQEMFGTQDASAQYGVGAMIRGTAAVRFAGNSTKVTFAGKQKLVTEIRAGSRPTTINESEADLNGRLVITRANACEVKGKTEVQTGVYLTWSAKFKGVC